LGPRLGRYGPSGEVREIGGHNLPLVALGVFILWLGWFGFNGGSTVEGNVSIGLIALNTHLAAAAGACAAVVFMQTTRQPVLMTNALNGGLAGLVGITAGCASMSPPFAVLTGAVAGVVVLLWMKLMDRMQWDDPVGAVAVHGACGAWGTLAAGMFHSDGLFQPGRIGVQLLGIVAYFVWCFPLAFLTFWVLNKTLSLRCDSRAERRGLDYAEHYEISYPEFAQEMLHQGKGG
jgi:Amt family ammonium transporter